MLEVGKASERWATLSTQLRGFLLDGPGIESAFPIEATQLFPPYRTGLSGVPRYQPEGD
ncbi:hypothetical protein BDW66DRAFT_23720 [Aspergillus desertorum]